MSAEQLFKVGHYYTTNGENSMKILVAHGCGCFDIEHDNGAIRTVTLDGFEHLWKEVKVQ